MNTRRKFLMRSGIITSALIAAKPFKTFAGISNSLAGSENNHLVFLHTAKDEFSFLDADAGYINSIKADAPGAILLHSGKKHDSDFRFDVPSADKRNDAPYTIISKKGLNTGVIYISGKGDSDIDQLNQTATFLKKEKDCQLVVCISSLGLKNRTAPDDMKLAAASKNIDLIIGGHSTNFSARTIVARNSEKHEVLIQSSKSMNRLCNKIEFSFDETGAKKHVHVAAKLRKHTPSV